MTAMSVIDTSQYLSELCLSISALPGLRSELDVPWFRLTIYEERSFVCAASVAWNNLPDSHKKTLLCHYCTLFSESSQDISFLSLLTRSAY